MWVQVTVRFPSIVLLLGRLEGPNGFSNSACAQVASIVAAGAELYGWVLRHSLLMPPQGTVNRALLLLAAVRGGQPTILCGGGVVVHTQPPRTTKHTPAPMYSALI
eukprot:Polyplicarium_translucidae@DN2737_c0_g1_i5.p4